MRALELHLLIESNLSFHHTEYINKIIWCRGPKLDKNHTNLPVNAGIAASIIVRLKPAPIYIP